MTETPAALLDRAAERLAAYAMHFEAYEAHFNPKSRFESPAEAWVYDTTDRNASAAQKLWVEILSPPTAAPLAAWLRLAAEDYKRRENLPKLGDPNPHGALVDVTGMFGPTYWTVALDLARLVLGEPAPAVLGALRWHYGPTDTDPDPGKMWCDDCGGEVVGFSEGYICGCGRSVDHVC